MPLSTKDLTPDPEPEQSQAPVGSDREELTCGACGLIYAQVKVPMSAHIRGCPRCGLQ